MFRLLILNNVPIFEQLRLEEALLRTSNENWCLLNTGSPPAIVMGISGKPEELLDLKRLAQDEIPVIKRFSGGGTVYIDPDTVFATLICNEEAVDIPLQPKALLKWSESFYSPILSGFQLRENDYALGDKKIGGNAQYIQKKRWLLHTSFLWDYSIEKMNYLLLPAKRPAYRQERSHGDFLSPLRPHFPSKERLIHSIVQQARNLGASEASLQEASHYLTLPHRMSTHFLNLKNKV